MAVQQIPVGFPLRRDMSPRVLTAILASLLYAGVVAPQSRHKIAFTFDYDFRITPACSPEVKNACVQQFNVYDISAGISKRVKLGSFPVPAGATGLVKGISVTTQPRLFNHGKHMLAVSAQLANGIESDPRRCTTIVKIR
jgi:hypothetical protein